MSCSLTVAKRLPLGIYHWAVVNPILNVSNFIGNLSANGSDGTRGHGMDKPLTNSKKEPENVDKNHVDHK
jgi:hypothetical protein